MCVDDVLNHYHYELTEPAIDDTKLELSIPSGMLIVYCVLRCSSIQLEPVPARCMYLMVEAKFCHIQG